MAQIKFNGKVLILSPKFLVDYHDKDIKQVVTRFKELKVDVNDPTSIDTISHELNQYQQEHSGWLDRSLARNFKITKHDTTE